MRLMLWLFVIGSAACSRPAATAPTPAGPDAAERELAEANVAWIEGRTAELCACADLACFDRIANDMNAWFPEHFGEARLDATQSGRLRDVREQVKSCQAAVAARVQADIDRPSDAALVEMKAIEDAMCACADVACVKRVSEEFEALATKYADIKATESQIKQASVIVGRITECATRAAGSP